MRSLFLDLDSRFRGNDGESAPFTLVHGPTPDTPLGLSGMTERVIPTCIQDSIIASVKKNVRPNTRCRSREACPRESGEREPRISGWIPASAGMTGCLSRNRTKLLTLAICLSQPPAFEIPRSPLCKEGKGGFSPFTLARLSKRGVINLKAKSHKPLALDRRSCPLAQRGLSICRLRDWHTGFTITEFVVALVLVGIGLALSLGMIMNRDWRASYKLNNMATSFQTTIQMARARAVARQGIEKGKWVSSGKVFKVIIRDKKASELASDAPVKTWTDAGLKAPTYGSDGFFTLDHTVDAAGKEAYGQEMWFYFNPDPSETGSDTHQIVLTRDPTVDTAETTADAEAPTTICFDPRGFATDTDPLGLGARKATYTAQIKYKGQVKMQFLITPMGRVTVMTPTQ